MQSGQPGVYPWTPTRAGKPSTLCSQVEPAVPAVRSSAASSGCWVAELSPASEGPRPGGGGQLGGTATAGHGLSRSLRSIACSCWNPAMNRRSIRCFHHQSHRKGPSRQAPLRARACGSDPERPSSCRPDAATPGSGGASPASGLEIHREGPADRTAQTPEAGRGSDRITAQSPLAKIRVSPSTCRC